jgi:hypothetical protein
MASSTIDREAAQERRHDPTGNAICAIEVVIEQNRNHILK